MKTKITALTLIAVTALSLAPKPAQASDKGLAVLGGFIGGVLVASALNDVRNDACPPTYGTTVVVNQREDRYDSGYWKVVALNVWVPSCWIQERGNYGRSYRRYVAGHYECRNDRVWVANGRNDRRNDHHDRNDREVGSGYGHRR